LHYCRRETNTNCMVTILSSNYDAQKMPHNSKAIQNWLSFVDDLQNFGDFSKRRSVRGFFSPALFHQSYDVWMHTLSLILGKWRSVERCTSVSDFLHDHYTIQCVIKNKLLWDLYVTWPPVFSHCESWTWGFSGNLISTVKVTFRLWNWYTSYTWHRKDFHNLRHFSCWSYKQFSVWAFRGQVTQTLTFCLSRSIAGYYSISLVPTTFYHSVALCY